MHRELKSSIPVLSCVGFVAGVANATIRIYKSKHWLKDVVAGAVIGIVSAQLAYFVVNKIGKKNKTKAKETDPNAEERKLQAELV